MHKKSSKNTNRGWKDNTRVRVFVLNAGGQPYLILCITYDSLKKGQYLNLSTVKSKPRMLTNVASKQTNKKQTERNILTGT